MTDYFTSNMDAAGRRERHYTRITMPVFDSVHFPQWTPLYPPELFNDFKVYSESYLLQCQVYFESLVDPKPEEKHWLRFLSRLTGQIHQWL